MTVSIQLANMCFTSSFCLLTSLDGIEYFIFSALHLFILVSWHHAQFPVAMGFMIAVLVDRTLFICGRVYRVVMFANVLATYVYRVVLYEKRW
jgi:hypothetical protein